MTLLELAEACEQAESGSRDLDAAIMMMVQKAGDYRKTPYTTSLDAAMQLVPEGYDWIVGNVNGYYGGTPYACVGNLTEHYGQTAVLALCAAALRTRHAMENEND